MGPGSETLASLAAKTISAAPSIPVFSNLDALPHPQDKAEIARRIGRHLTNPVRFTEMISAMYEAGGARVFVEVGPGGALTPLIGEILAGLPHLAVACDTKGRPGLVGLLHAVAKLTIGGIPLRLERLTEGRSTKRLDLEALPAGDGSEPLAPSTWMVNGSRSRPLNAPEPKRLGQAVERPPSTSRDQRMLRETRQTIPMKIRGRSFHRRTANRIRPLQPTAMESIVRVNRLPSHATDPVPPKGSERVLAAFQETMKSFLEVQRETMLVYLGRPQQSARIPGSDQAGSTSFAARPERSASHCQVESPACSNHVGDAKTDRFNRRDRAPGRSR